MSGPYYFEPEPDSTASPEQMALAQLWKVYKALDWISELFAENASGDDPKVAEREAYAYRFSSSMMAGAARDLQGRFLRRKR